MYLCIHQFISFSFTGQINRSSSHLQHFTAISQRFLYYWKKKKEKKGKKEISNLFFPKRRSDGRNWRLPNPPPPILQSQSSLYEYEWCAVNTWILYGTRFEIILDKWRWTNTTINCLIGGQGGREQSWYFTAYFLINKTSSRHKNQLKWLENKLFLAIFKFPIPNAGFYSNGFLSDFSLKYFLFFALSLSLSLSLFLSFFISLAIIWDPISGNVGFLLFFAIYRWIM